eukprot:GHVO01045976.1.p1 GENE.GHVO01045976.1~~GHVO01045976.1.p1  ORF type:complete len:680 (-),score=114.67 GHVO01045976.1:200-2239(-)
MEPELCDLNSFRKNNGCVAQPWTSEPCRDECHKNNHMWDEMGQVKTEGITHPIIPQAEAEQTPLMTPGASSSHMYAQSVDIDADLTRKRFVLVPHSKTGRLHLALVTAAYVPNSAFDTPSDSELSRIIQNKNVMDAATTLLGTMAEQHIAPLGIGTKPLADKEPTSNVSLMDWKTPLSVPPVPERMEEVSEYRAWWRDVKEGSASMPSRQVAPYVLIPAPTRCILSAHTKPETAKEDSDFKGFIHAVSDAPKAEFDDTDYNGSGEGVYVPASSFMRTTDAFVNEIMRGRWHMHSDLDIPLPLDLLSAGMEAWKGGIKGYGSYSNVYTRGQAAKQGGLPTTSRRRKGQTNGPTLEQELNASMILVQAGMSLSKASSWDKSTGVTGGRIFASENGQRTIPNYASLQTQIAHNIQGSNRLPVNGPSGASDMSDNEPVGSRLEVEFDMIKRNSGWHPYVWFLMCRRPELYSMGVRAMDVAKVAGLEWDELQRYMPQLMEFVEAIERFLTDFPAPNPQDKRNLKAYKQMAAHAVRTPLHGIETAAVKLSIKCELEKTFGDQAGMDGAPTSRRRKKPRVFDDGLLFHPHLQETGMPLPEPSEPSQPSQAAPDNVPKEPLESDQGSKLTSRQVSPLATPEGDEMILRSPKDTPPVPSSNSSDSKVDIEASFIKDEDPRMPNWQVSV